MHFSMIHSLYLVYKACKYSRLNGSLSLVCKSPDSSKPETEAGGRKRERKAINGLAAAGQRDESDNGVAVEHRRVTSVHSC